MQRVFKISSKWWGASLFVAKNAEEALKRFRRRVTREKRSLCDVEPDRLEPEELVDLGEVG